jgi:hypothetical protein
MSIKKRYVRICLKKLKTSEKWVVYFKFPGNSFIEPFDSFEEACYYAKIQWEFFENAELSI